MFESSQSASVSSRLLDGGRYSCRLCGLHYARSSDLRRHHKNKHENKHTKPPKLHSKNENPHHSPPPTKPDAILTPNVLFSDAAAITQSLLNSQSTSRAPVRSDALLAALSQVTNGTFPLANSSNISPSLCMCNICGVQCSSYDELCTHYLNVHPFRANNTTATAWDWWKVLQSSNLFDINFWSSSLSSLLPSAVSQQSAGGSSEQDNLLRSYNLQSPATQPNCSSLGALSTSSMNHNDTVNCSNSEDQRVQSDDVSHSLLEASQMELTQSDEMVHEENGGYLSRRDASTDRLSHRLSTSIPKRLNETMSREQQPLNTGSAKVSKRSRAPIGTHICRICGLRYVYAGDLRRHEKRKHPGVVHKRKMEVPKQLEIEMKKEIEECHVSTQGSVSPVSEASSSNRQRSGEREGLHVCQICGLRYMRSGDLRRHQVKKHELRPRTRRGPYFSESSILCNPNLLNTQPSPQASSVPPAPPPPEPEPEPELELAVQLEPDPEPEPLPIFDYELEPEPEPEPVAATPTKTSSSKEESGLPYTCEDCDMSFRTIEVLRFHQMCLHPDLPAISSTEPLTNHTDGSTSLNLPPLETPEFPQPVPSVGLRGRKRVLATHECSICGLSYVHRSDLRRHQRQKHKLLI